MQRRKGQLHALGPNKVQVRSIMSSFLDRGLLFLVVIFGDLETATR